MDSGERGWGHPAVFDSASAVGENQDVADPEDPESSVVAPEHVPDTPNEGGGEAEGLATPNTEIQIQPESGQPLLDGEHTAGRSGEDERPVVDSPAAAAYPDASDPDASDPDSGVGATEGPDQSDDASRSVEIPPGSTDDTPLVESNRAFDPASVPEAPPTMPDGAPDPVDQGVIAFDPAPGAPPATFGAAEPESSVDPESPVDPEPDERTGTAAPPRTSPRPLPRTLAIANQKGGVGKTTTAVNLGAGLAALGYRVLVVDLDPQGNATTGLGVDARNLSASVYDVLLADRPLEDAVEPTAVRNLFVVPATLDLAGAEIELVPAFSRELKLRRAVDGLDGQFDFTLIDCPPSLGLLTVNGLAAADEVLVPVQCEYYALEGLGQLLRNIQLVQSNLNPRLELSTIVLTMYDARTKLSDQVASEVRSHFGPRVCRNIVPRSVRLSEAPSFGQPIIVFDPTSRGAIAYRELAKEVSGGAPRRSG